MRYKPKAVVTNHESRITNRRGFTLIEAALVTVIIGVGVLAMMQLLAAGTMSNIESTELTTGLNLANNIRELTQSLKYAESDTTTHWGLEIDQGETKFTADDLDDLDGQSFSPPIDARRIGLGKSFTDWKQEIAVAAVDPNNLKSPMGHVGLTAAQRPTARVTVTIKHHEKQVCQVSWLMVYIHP